MTIPSVALRRRVRSRALWALLLAALSVGQSAQAVEPDSAWDQVLEAAQGQSVFFAAWGGGENINAYLEWVADRVQEDYGVTLEHVKVGDIAEVVGQLEAAKAVGRDSQGNVDLMWVNGENFASLKRQDLLWGRFAPNLPNAQFLLQGASIETDFSVPVDGLESPWGGAQLVFIHDGRALPEPPRSATELLRFVQQGGRFAYPAPPQFHGTTFIKQLLIELIDEPAVLAEPVPETGFDRITAPLWDYLDELHPGLWGRGESWPVSIEATRQMLDDGELELILSFNPSEAASAVNHGLLPDSVRTYVFDAGTIGNHHFVTIPWNANAPAGAMLVANFLLSPEAQARKADAAYWGDPSVLDPAALNGEQRALFEAGSGTPWALPDGSAPALAEPHASWAEALEAEWLRRYTR